MSSLPIRSGEIAGAVIVEYPLDWPAAASSSAAVMPMRSAQEADCCPVSPGSTHELAFVGGSLQTLWVSGQNYDHLARLASDGTVSYFPMGPGSAPHGLALDLEGRLWVTFEGRGEIAMIDADGCIAATVDVRMHVDGAAVPINPRPHGLGLGPDGSLWFTGKLTNTVGRVEPDGSVSHYPLPTIGAVPIYIAAGADGNMWCTELLGNAIARICPDGTVTEFAIPTANSRPIMIIPGPDGAMWFTQEAGGKVARITPEGVIVEFPVPLTRRDAILAGLAFGPEGDLWVQQYLPLPCCEAPGDDYLVRLNGLLGADPGDLTNVGVQFVKAPLRQTIMHRIKCDPAGTIWFTELGLNRVGRVTTGTGQSAGC